MKTLVVSLVLFAGTAFALDAGQAPLRGYTPEHSATEVQWEQKFRALPERRDCARTCGDCRRGRTMLARPTTRTTPNGCWRS